MGGTLAQLVWKRHPTRVRGLVLCATAAHFVTSRPERAGFTFMSGVGIVSRVVPKSVRTSISNRLYVSRKTLTWEPWAAKEIADHDWRQILQAGAALGRFDSRKWLPTVNVPTAVLRTTQDAVVNTERQKVLTQCIPGAREYTIDANHDAVFTRASEFVPLLVQACLTVDREAQERTPIETV